ncbi:hypothetical protein F4803DRAFT_576466 [Xylaria telfairii]|nr:hypothetical protein F4803DRAFT_576466 [Xylaria telfairii]
MSSSQGSSSSAGYRRYEGNTDNHDDNLFVDDDDIDEGDPALWLPAGNNDGDDDEVVEDEENLEPDVENDDSSEVDPDVMDDSSEEEPDPKRKAKRKAKGKPKAKAKVPARPRNSNPRPRICQGCVDLRRQWNEEVTRITEEFRANERRLNATIRELEGKLRGNRIHQNPWGPRLAELMRGIRARDPNLVDTNYAGYSAIFHDSCNQGIMAPDFKITHPELRIQVQAYSGQQIRQHFIAQMIQDRDNGALHDLVGMDRSYRDILLPSRFTRPRPLPLLENIPFNFDGLPIAIQCRIWKLVIPNSEMIHCLSRLDPRTPPLDCVANVVHFPIRFHIGNSICNIAKADKPSRFLRLFQVSKRWYYALAHLFYGTNTFAFSSLGEFGRFCNGIGKARVQRLVNVELMWRGALTPRQRSGVSLRKQPLSWFMHTHRLRTLVVHINESKKQYMRRAYEMMQPSDYDEDFANEDEYNEDELDIFGMEVRRTEFQPNYRKTRSMRTVQGMDFIYQLRGMRYVRFYDSNAGRARQPIQDWSFLQDINNVARRRKSDATALKTEIENLLYLPGLQDFRPDDQLHELVKSFYDETPVEDVSVGGSETSDDSSDVSGFSTFSGDSGPDDDSGGPSHAASGSSRGSSDHDMGGVIEILDSDDEMEDDDRPSDGSSSNVSPPSYVAPSETMSVSRRSLLSGSSSSDANPYDTGNTTVTPQLPLRALLIGDDDNDDRNRHRGQPGGGFNTDSSDLFMPSGSGTAGSTGNATSSDNERSSEVIDLTLEDDDDDESRGSASSDSSEAAGPVSSSSRKRSGSNDSQG